MIPLPLLAVSEPPTIELAETRCPEASIDIATVFALDDAYQAAVKRNDAAAMDRILTADFVLVTGRGDVIDKQQLLQEARDGTVTYEHQEDSQKTVRLLTPDTAVVTALLRVKGESAGESFDYSLWFSDIYLRTPEGWRYAFAQASTRLPTAP